MSSTAGNRTVDEATAKKVKGMDVTSAVYLRKQFQKIEFAVCWAAIFLLAYASNTGGREDEVVSFVALVFRFTVLTRFVAYTVDFWNAWVTYNSTIPMWLISHHAGTFAVHYILFVHLTPTSYPDMIVCVLATQATHNSWTKKYSLTMYWANTMVGLLTAWYYFVMVVNKRMFASMCLFSVLFVTSVGVSLLMIDSVGTTEDSKHRTR